jgi:hypothetical protein
MRADSRNRGRLRVVAAAVAGLGGLVAVARIFRPAGTPRIRGSARSVATLERYASAEATSGFWKEPKTSIIRLSCTSMAAPGRRS